MEPDSPKDTDFDPGQGRSATSSESVDPPDDTVIAQALWRSLAVLALLGMVAGAAIWFLARDPKSVPSRITPLTPPTLPATLHRDIPKVQFTDVTSASGIRFIHTNGAHGAKYLPETMGGGVAFFDYNNDGRPDLLFVNCRHWPESDIPEENQPRCALYRNDTEPGGPIQFTDVTIGSGLDISLYGMGVACGDFDNDGWVDVFITALGKNRLFKNLGVGPDQTPRFEEVTDRAGVGGDPNTWSTAAAWVDLNNNGRLDLFVGNYVVWNAELDREVNNQLVGVGRAYGRPWNFLSAGGQNQPRVGRSKPATLRM